MWEGCTSFAALLCSTPCSDLLVKSEAELEEQLKALNHRIEVGAGLGPGHGRPAHKSAVPTAAAL